MSKVCVVCNDISWLSDMRSALNHFDDGDCIILNNAKAMSRLHSCRRLKKGSNSYSNVHILDPVGDPKLGHYIVSIDSIEDAENKLCPIEDPSVIIEVIEEIYDFVYLCQISDPSVMESGRMNLAKDSMEDYHNDFASVLCGSTPPDACGINAKDILVSQLRGLEVAFITSDCTTINCDIPNEKFKYCHPKTAKFVITQSEAEKINESNNKLIVGSSTYRSYMTALNASDTIDPMEGMTIDHSAIVDGVSFLATVGSDLTDRIFLELIGKERLAEAREKLTPYEDCILFLNHK